MKNFDFPDLAKFAGRPFPAGYPVQDHVTLCAPEDNLTGALVFFIGAAEHAVSLTLPHRTDNAVTAAVLRKLQEPDVLVRLVTPYLTLEPGPHEKAFKESVNFPGNHVVLSDAPVRGWHGAVDGLDSFSGDSGVLTFTRHPLVAFRVQCMIDRAGRG